MRELSLNILDIAQNSISAKATLISIEIAIDTVKDYMQINISDNGCGMDKDFLKKVTDPFTTTRTTRKVGLGIPLFKMSALMANGSFSIDSEKNKGTFIKAQYQLSNVDRMPLGDIADTIVLLIQADKHIHLIYRHVCNGNEYIFDTDNIKEVLGEIDITNYEIMSYIKDMIRENILSVQAGEIY